MSLFDEMSFLARTDPRHFESRRRDMLDQFIEEQLHDSASAISLQLEINTLRQSLAPEQFLQILASMLQASLRQMSSEMSTLDEETQRLQCSVDQLTKSN